MLPVRPVAPVYDGLYLPVCWSDGYFLWCCVFSQFSFLFVCILLFLIRGVVCCGLSRLLVEF
jgi:hypothetical protein